MDDRRATALGQIPLPYSIALRLRDAGISDALIAQCIGVDVAGLAALMTIAEAKLAAAEAADHGVRQSGAVHQEDAGADR